MYINKLYGSMSVAAVSLEERRVPRVPRKVAPTASSPQIVQGALSFKKLSGRSPASQSPLLALC